MFHPVVKLVSLRFDDECLVDTDGDKLHGAATYCQEELVRTGLQLKP